MNIIKRHIDDLVPAEYNPRVDLKPGDKEYEKLKRSIEEFGYVEPIIYNKKNNTVVGGHQRLKVLKDLGYTDIDVVEVDLNENDEKALNIALNKVSGDWDNEKLEELLNELNNEADFDISLTGFDENEINSLLESIDLPDNIDDMFRELTEEENRKHEEKNKICIKIGQDIKIDITKDEYDSIKSQYKEFGEEAIKSRLMGAVG